ncbi:MAG: hypothetical protein OXI93_02775, partial [Bryobacterales bacterium]|nr:hypothetical protein [Bryobacterales bacterium]
MVSDTTERGLEEQIVGALVDRNGYVHGEPEDYDREYCVDWAQLVAFLSATQPDVFEGLRLEDAGPARRELQARRPGAGTPRGVIALR